MSKICCGGFELGEGLELDGKKLKVSDESRVPAPSEDGAALIGYDGKFVEVPGYGYETPKPFEDIVWDGNIEGHAVATVTNAPSPISYYKIGEYINANDFVGACVVLHEDPPARPTLVEIYEENVYDSGEYVVVNVYSLYIYSFSKAGDFAAGGSVILHVPEAGLYVLETGNYVQEIFYPTTVKTFDEKYIPNPFYTVHIEMTEGQNEYIFENSNKTVSEIMAACKDGKNIIFEIDLWNDAVSASTILRITTFSFSESPAPTVTIPFGTVMGDNAALLGSITEEEDSWTIL